MSKKCGSLGLNGLQLKCIISTQSNWKNQNSGSHFGATCIIALPIQPIYRKNGPNGLNWQCSLAGSSKKAPPGFWFFQLPWVPIIHFRWNPLLLVPPHFCVYHFRISQSGPVWINCWRQNKAELWTYHFKNWRTLNWTWDILAIYFFSSNFSDKL